MSYSVEEFRPANPTLSINGRDFEISLITLHIDSKIKTKFTSLENIFDQIRIKPMRIFDALWILILDKAYFNHSQEKLKEAILSECKTSEVTGKIIEVFNEAIGKSMPIIKNKKRYEELLKINQTQEERKPCYAVYYDTLAKRYGYSIDEFYNLTLRQLHILLHVVGDQSYEEIEVQAALQGKKLKPRMKPLDIEEDDDKRLDEDAVAAHAQLMKEYNERQGK
jgi:hypothetical protein